jgi:hypothetical protein
MPSYYLCPLNWAQINTTGIPLSGGTVTTYLAGTSTLAQTFTDNTGGTPQTNPIVLNTRGIPPSPIWMLGGQALKFVIKDALGNLLQTFDGVTGINDNTNFAATLAASTGASLVAWIRNAVGAVKRLVSDKLGDVVTFEDFGTTGDDTADDTAFIQAALNSAIAAGYKRIRATRPAYKITSQITIPQYYSAGIASKFWGSAGKDFVIDFGTSIVHSTAAAGTTAFLIPVGDTAGLSRYNLDVLGGQFMSDNKLADWFRYSGGSYWNCSFQECVVSPGQQNETFVRLYNTSAAAEPGILRMQDLLTSGDHALLFDNTAGGMLFTDNFHIDGIYHFGQSDTGYALGLQANCGLYNAKISRIVQVGKGGVVGDGSGYLAYSELSDLYSETTTNNENLVAANLQNCTFRSARASITDTATQTVSWYAGQSIGSTFDTLHVTGAGGVKPYNSEAYAYYPVIKLTGASADNIVSGYNQGELYNAVSCRNGVISAIGVADAPVVTRQKYDATSITTTGFVQAGSSVPAVKLLGNFFVLDIHHEGKAVSAGAKTLAVELRIGATTISLSGDLSVATDAWKAQARVVFSRISSTQYQVILSHGTAWVAATPYVVSAGTADSSAIYVNETDAITFGLNVKAIAGTVVVGAGSMQAIKFGIYDTLV